MGSTRRSEDRPRTRGRVPGLGPLARLVRRRPRGALAVVAACLVVALGAPRWFGGGATTGALVLVAFLSYGAGLVVLAVAIADDESRPDTGGTRRAIITVLTGGLAAVPWAIEDPREPGRAHDTGGSR